MYDLVVSGGTAVTPFATEPADIAVQGEEIVAIEPPGSFDGQAAKVIDASGRLVLPGGIDPHCHYGVDFQGICTTEGQEFSPAAAFGGTTTIIDFVMQEPPSTLHDAIAAKKAQSEGLMAVDWSLHAITTGEVSFEVMEEIGDVIRSGIPTIKTLTTYGWITDDGRRLGVMTEVAENGGMSVIHAEDDAIANFLTAKYIREGKTYGAYISEVRGPIVEEAAIRRAMLLAERTGSPLYVLHMAAGSGIAALNEGRARGLPFYGETLLAYLCFDNTNLWDRSPVEVNGKTYPSRGLLYNNYPCLKFPEDKEACWEAIASDQLQAVGTDHCLISLADRFEKLGSELPFVQAGQAAVDLRLPVLFDLGVQSGRLSLERFVDVVSTNPAKIMGLWPKKGQLAVGSDADIVVLDPNKEWTVRWQDLHMSAEYSCWDDVQLRGSVETTILRGSILVQDGQFVGSKSGGRFLPRTLLPEVVSSPPDYSLTRGSPVAS